MSHGTYERKIAGQSACLSRYTENASIDREHVCSIGSRCLKKIGAALGRTD